jgi:hypothetical protein
MPTSGSIAMMGAGMMFWRRIDAFVRRQNPWISILGLLLSLLVAAYLALPQKGVLGYRHSVIKIFDSGSAESLRLVAPDNGPIEADVYAIETTLANSGNTAFDAADFADLLRLDFRKAQLFKLG